LCLAEKKPDEGNVFLNLHNPGGYSYKSFLDEARNIVLTSKGALYIHLIFIKKGTWLNLHSVMDMYSSDGRRRWLVNMMALEKDFYVLEYVNKDNDADLHYFFWKVWKDDADFITVLSFSIEKFEYAQGCLKSLVHSNAGMSFSWIDSRILENFDEIAKSVLGEIVYKIDRATIELRPVGEIGKPASEVRWAFRDKEELFEKRRSEYENFKRIFYMKRLRCSIRKGGYGFKITLSDEGELLLEEGDLFSFLELIQPLIESLTRLRDVSRKKIVIQSTEREEKKIGSRSIDLLEILAFEVSETMTTDWFSNIAKIFSTPVLGDENLVNFTLKEGNPYFLAHVIDTENGSAVYLSATADEIRISPVNEETSIATVSKIVRVLQRYIDPMLVPCLV
jgi:hypothetical protein